MRVLIAAVGSRGDVAPFTGLGVRLQDEGHQVTIATHGLFEAYVTGCGLGFHRLPVDTREELAARVEADGGRSPARMTLAVNRALAAHAGETAAALTAAARDADVLLLTPLSWIGGHVAEGLGLPSIGVYLQPMTPTREFPPATVTTRTLGGWGNRTAASALRIAGMRPSRRVVDELRAGFGLPPVAPGAWLAGLEASRWPICYGFSPLVVPPPADWPDFHRPVGYWWPAPEPDFKPGSELAGFLASGPPPIYVGFGSLPATDRAALSSLVGAAIREAGVRAVVHGGWGGLTVAGDDVLAVEDVPHSWLFPRMAAVVHHAGAGTAAAGLRAGVPSVPVPFMVDQPFWAGRLHRLGVTPGPIPMRRLTAGRLAAALTQAIGDPVYRQRATEIAALLAREDGAAGVVQRLREI
ncbi:glycosyl transferase [Actinoplanes italicus]|uniref:UDP:flavonoid glycosyltransferase YjiC (YdhE family) n=1 Tax=Actinoplanes italicus TaxID=113567 RepID=A0A2T0K5X6_9ACTN|nr:glycosyltransferase [Actinoplanes italicus]PRX18367.1 UDP:flavonoid glycosyltransferase YjiC (YdhE family) [Actinoplanes italicus]GIE32776.1 glycosyl transferase [Actinoplanes italicus]